MSASIDQELLKRLVFYDEDTGIFTWRVKPSRNIRVGDVAGGRTGKKGYIGLRVEGKNIYAHRAAWLYCFGSLPDELDHINRDKSDNRIANLRPATRSQNQGNKSLQRNNASGVKGVYWAKANRKWCAMIKENGKQRYLGYFEKLDDAAQAYASAARAHFGDFASHA